MLLAIETAKLHVPPPPGSAYWEKGSMHQAKLQHTVLLQIYLLLGSFHSARELRYCCD